MLLTQQGLMQVYRELNPGQLCSRYVSITPCPDRLFTSAPPGLCVLYVQGVDLIYNVGD